MSNRASIVNRAESALEELAYLDEFKDHLREDLKKLYSDPQSKVNFRRSVNDSLARLARDYEMLMILKSEEE